LNSYFGQRRKIGEENNVGSLHIKSVKEVSKLRGLDLLIQKNSVWG